MENYYVINDYILDDINDEDYETILTLIKERSVIFFESSIIEEDEYLSLCTTNEEIYDFDEQVISIKEDLNDIIIVTDCATWYLSKCDKYGTDILM